MSDIFILAPDPSGAVCDCTQLATVCASCTPSTCSCVLLFPTVLESPVPSNTFLFSDVAAAKTALTESCVDCYTITRGSKFITDSGVPATSVSSGAVGSVSATYPSFFDDTRYRLTNSHNYIGISLKKDDVVPITYNVSTDATFTAGDPVCSNGINLQCQLTIYDCATGGIVWLGVGPFTFCDEEEGFVNVSGPSTSGTITGFGIYVGDFKAPSDSVFYFEVAYTYGAQGGSLNVLSSSTVSTVTTFTIPVGRTAVPVLAEYTNPSDPLVPYQLEACPAFYIPPFAPTLGVYADLATAQAELDYGVSCIAYASPVGFPPNVYSGMSATPSAHSLSLVGTVTMPDTDGNLNLFIWGGFYLSESTLLTITWTSTNVGSTAANNTVGIFTTDDSSVFSFFSSVITASTTVMLPIGKYVFLVKTIRLGSTTMTATWTIGGTGFLNQTLVALYANGTNCPTHLACTP